MLIIKVWVCYKYVDGFDICGANVIKFSEVMQNWFHSSPCKNYRFHIRHTIIFRSYIIFFNSGWLYLARCANNSAHRFANFIAMQLIFSQFMSNWFSIVIPESCIAIVVTAENLFNNLWVIHFFLAHPAYSYSKRDSENIHSLPDRFSINCSGWKYVSSKRRNK